MKNISEAIRVLQDAEVVLTSKLLEDSERIELLHTLDNMFPPEMMSSQFHKVVQNAIQRGCRKCTADQEQGRKTEGRKEPTQVAPQGTKEATKATSGKTQRR